MRMLVIQALENLGFSNVHEAQDGQDALDFLAKSPVELIISDIEMRPVNGLDFVKQVRSGDTSLPRGVPVIFLSGLGDTSTLSAASELDVHGFIVKPVSANQLREYVGKAMEAEVRLRDVNFYRSLNFAPAKAELRDRPGLEGSTYRITTQVVSSNSTTEPSADHQSSSEKARKAPTQGRKRSRLSVDELRAGMILEEDIMARGVPLLKRGLEVTPGHLMVLRDMRSMLDQNDVEVEISASATD